MSGEGPERNRLVIVSNRLPVVLHRGEGDRWGIKPGSGGLVTALAPVLRDRGGLWIGWPGVSKEDAPQNLDSLLATAVKDAGYSLSPVLLTDREIKGYYYGFANEILWPLFHDLPSRCNFDPSYWRSYLQVNRKFARVIAENSRRNDFIWVHDYHLICVAQELRRLGISAPVAFFLHIPFPPLDIFLRLPWRFQILQALLQFDLIGFQTIRDRRNFVHCVRKLLKDARIYGKGQVILGEFGGKKIRIGAFPIGIDFNEFARGAATKEVADRAWYTHEEYPNQTIVLGIDRLDYTKGIPERLFAFRAMLSAHPEVHEKVCFIQVVVPSREGVPEYQSLKQEIERLVSEVNGRFGRPGWIPVHYFFRSLERTELLAYYRTAEVALVTPLKDGMNLVSKEYCAANLEENGVLILSEFAGAAAQLRRGAILVNPHDVEGVAQALYEAITMPKPQRRERMRRLRAVVRKQDIFWWVESFLRAAFAKDLKSFPIIEDYIPTVR